MVAQAPLAFCNRTSKPQGDDLEGTQHQLTTSIGCRLHGDRNDSSFDQIDLDDL